MAEATYDVYVNDGQRWTMERNFGAGEEADAIAFAEDLFRGKKIIGVRVVMETTDPATGQPRDKTVFKKEKQASSGKAAAGATSGAPLDMSGAPGARGAAGGSAAGGALTHAAAISSAAAAQTTTMGRQPVNTSALLTKAAAAAACAGAVAVVIHIFLSQMLGTRGYGGAVTGGTIAIFAASYVGLSWMLLSSAEIQQIVQFAMGLRPSHQIDLGPAQMIAPPRPAALSPARPAEPSTDAATDEPTAAAPGDGEAPLDFEVERHRLHLLEDDNKALITFLHDALKGLAEIGKHLAGGKLDAYNTFGAHIFLAGATESLGRTSERSKNEMKWVLSRALAAIFADDKNAANFAEHYEEYLMQPKYLDMFKAGADAMDLRRANGAGIGPLFAVALDRWSDKAERRTTDYAVVMFTDIVGSTEHTQSHGDEAHYEVLKAHNVIVRQALSEHSGREIKHTGDGIMASFSSAYDGVVCAIQVQRAVAIHNAQHADSPILLRIGLNAGEPIKEGTDLFGSTVQLAARVCSQADTGQIVISYVVQGLCAARNLSFANLGARQLKGFKDPIEIYRVLWE